MRAWLLRMRSAASSRLTLGAIPPRDPAVHAQAEAVPGGRRTGARSGAVAGRACRGPAGRSASAEPVGLSQVSPLRLPPVVIAATGMPCASTIRRCSLPTLPRPTSPPSVAGPPRAGWWLTRPPSRGCDRRRPLRGRNPAGLRPTARAAAARTATALPEPGSVPVPQPSPAVKGAQKPSLLRRAVRGRFAGHKEGLGRPLGEPALIGLAYQTGTHGQARPVQQVGHPVRVPPVEFE